MSLSINNHHFVSFLFFALFLLLNVSSSSSRASSHGAYELNDDVTISDFPHGFLFGAATSAYQIEGAYLADGKGLSNWDVFSHAQGNVLNGQTGDVADDHFHRYMDDIEILDSLGVRAYRFSISWSRILPRGRFGEVNLAGIEFYNKIIDTLVLKGIEPFVTLHHCDFPQELEDRYASWLSPCMQEDFAYYAETCFKYFGNRVKYWMTINEPNLSATLSYQLGLFPPRHCSPPFGNCSAGNSVTEPLVAMHNMLLSHARAAKLYREEFQKEQGGVIGIVVHAYLYVPLTDSELDKAAASRAMAFFLGWVLDPLISGDYPREMRRHYKAEMPKFTAEEKEVIKGSIDFIGLNYYTSVYAKDCLRSRCTCNAPQCGEDGDSFLPAFVYISGRKDGVLIGEPTGLPGFYVTPKGLEDLVDYVKNRYNNTPIFITENGYSSPNDNGQQDNAELLLDDIKRIDFHKSHLSFLARAIRNGADVRGYFIWTLMDDFEWVNGYGVRFGLHYVNLLTLERIPRSSAAWLRDFLTNKQTLSYKYHLPSQTTVM